MYININTWLCMKTPTLSHQQPNPWVACFTSGAHHDSSLKESIISLRLSETKQGFHFWLGGACSQTPPPQLAVPWHSHAGPQGRWHLMGYLRGPSMHSMEQATRGKIILCCCHICIYLYLSWSKLLGLWLILLFRIWRSSCTKGMHANKALLALVCCWY